MSNGVKSLEGRSLITCQRCYFKIKDVYYVFTIGAGGSIITAEAITNATLFRNAVYARIDGDLLCLEDFAHLKDLRTVLPDCFIQGNRGVFVNGERIGFPEGSDAVGFWLRDHQGRRRKETIRLSPDGKRELNKFVIRCPQPRPALPPNPQKTTPRAPFQRGD